MTTSTPSFWQFMDHLRREPFYRLDLCLNVLQQAREQGIPVSLDDVRRLVALQRHEGIFLSDAYIPEFITAYLRHVQIHSILDPFAGIGAFLSPVALSLRPKHAIGLNSNPRVAEIAQIIHENTSVGWRVGNPSELLCHMTEPFDAIIGCPHLGMPKETQALDHQGHIITLHDESGRIIAAQALRLLDTQGVAVFLTTSSFLFTADPRSVSAATGTVRAFISMRRYSLRRGAFESETHIHGLLVILKRERPNRVFVGELDAEAVKNGTLLDNLIKRKESKLPQLGILVKRSSLTSVEAVFAEQRIRDQSRKMGVPATSLEDVALEINLVRSPQSFDPKPNSVSVPSIGRSNAIASLDDLKNKPHNYVQLVLDPEKANAHYVADFFNTPLGLLVQGIAILWQLDIPHHQDRCGPRATLLAEFGYPGSCSWRAGKTHQCTDTG